jgi:hypothetical protein
MPNPARADRTETPGKIMLRCRRCGWITEIAPGIVPWPDGTRELAEWGFARHNCPWSVGNVLKELLRLAVVVLVIYLSFCTGRRACRSEAEYFAKRGTAQACSLAEYYDHLQGGDRYSRE